METMTAKKIANRIAKEKKEIAMHKAQKEVSSIIINIEWNKSRTWGNCPSATAEVSYKDGSFERKDGYYASGCGYDKESTVIAEIFNDFLRYKLYQKRELKSRINQEDTNHPYGVYYYNGEAIAPKEGEYWYRKPSYSGGVGTSCYYNIAEFIGGKFENVASGKRFDSFKYTDNI